jgi:hypothetical protein
MCGLLSPCVTTGLTFFLSLPSHDISKVSIFNLTVPEEMNQLFSVIGSMLSSSDQTARHFWKTCKFKDKVETCFVSIWLVRRKDEDPSCFQMIMVPMSECDGNLCKNNLIFFCICVHVMILL